MLDARYLASLSDDLIELYSQLEFEIKQDIFKRLNKLKKVTELTEYQMQILQEVGGLKSDVRKLVDKYDKKARDELKKLYTEAMKTATEKDLRYFAQAERELSTNQTQSVKALIDRLIEPDKTNLTYATRIKEFEAVFSSLTRMTATVADATEKEFIKAVNNAYLKVSSGAYSWQSAYRTAVNDLARNGVKAVLYTGSGKAKTFSIEAACKMNIITGINQTASQQTLENCSSLDTDLVEVSAHIGARNRDVDGREWANHEDLQGKVYCLNGERDYIDSEGNTKHAYNFYEKCGLGEPDGICGINCRHSFYPYVEGTPLMYSKNELSEMADDKVKLNGVEVTPYEAEQELRQCERAIRLYKSEALGYELTLDTENNPNYISARNSLYNWQEKARAITKETGINRKYINEYIGTKDGKQPRGLKPKNEE